MKKNILFSFLAFLFLSTNVFAGWDEGVAAFKAGNYKLAVAEFQEVVAQNPEGYDGHYMLGLSLEALGKKAEALNHIRKAYDLNPNDLSVKVALGRAYYANGKFSEASKILAVSAKENPGNAEVHSFLGFSHLKLGNKDEALNHLRKAYDLNPNDLSVKKALRKLGEKI